MLGTQIANSFLRQPSDDNLTSGWLLFVKMQSLGLHTCALPLFESDWQRISSFEFFWSNRLFLKKWPYLYQFQFYRLGKILRNFYVIKTQIDVLLRILLNAATEIYQFSSNFFRLSTLNKSPCLE